jgi:hypothetical protein
MAAIFESQGRRFPAAFFVIGILDPRHFVALQTSSCCYANKAVAIGIWYT